MTGSPTVIGGRYALVRTLGEGGMAEVWLATDERLNGRYVAVKRLLHRTGGTDAAEQVERARREAYAVSGLHHPNIVSVTDFLTEQGEPVIVMEYVQGRTLQELGALPAEQAAWLVSQVASGLAEAHARGIAHRDVKPANVLVTDRGEAKLADFGIARLEGDPRLTATGMFTGTIRYLAPEILDGRPATPASDVWSLGSTLYEAVEGRPAFDAPTHVALMGAIAMGPVPRVVTAPSLAPLVARMLDRDPSRRPTAAAVAGELRALAGGAVPSYPPPPPPVPPVPPDAPTVVRGTPRPPPGNRPPAKRRNRAYLLVAAPVAVIAAAAAIAVGVRSGDTGGSGSLAGAQPSASLSNEPSSRSSDAQSTPPASASSTSGPPTAGGPAPAPASTAPDGTVSFEGVRVGNARNLRTAPRVTSSSSVDPNALRTLDLVVGGGAAAAPTSTVTVQYVGVLYRNGTEFDSSWARGQPTAFPLTQVIPGFTRAIGGAPGIAPMRVGGRRLMIIPSSLGYGATAQGTIPANSPLVFVVDLVKVG